MPTSWAVTSPWLSLLSLASPCFQSWSSESFQEISNGKSKMKIRNLKLELSNNNGISDVCVYTVYKNNMIYGYGYITQVSITNEVQNYSVEKYWKHTGWYFSHEVGIPSRRFVAHHAPLRTGRYHDRSLIREAPSEFVHMSSLSPLQQSFIHQDAAFLNILSVASARPYLIIVLNKPLKTSSSVRPQGGTPGHAGICRVPPGFEWLDMHFPFSDGSPDPRVPLNGICKRFLSGKLWTASFTGAVASPGKPKGSSRWRATSCRPRALGNLCRNSFSVELYNGLSESSPIGNACVATQKLHPWGVCVCRKRLQKQEKRKIIKSFLRSGAHKPSTRFSGFNTPFCAGHSNIYLIEHDTVERTVGSVPSHVTQDHGLCFLFLHIQFGELRGCVWGVFRLEDGDGFAWISYWVHMTSNDTHPVGCWVAVDSRENLHHLMQLGATSPPIVVEPSVMTKTVSGMSFQVIDLKNYLASSWDTCIKTYSYLNLNPDTLQTMISRQVNEVTLEYMTLEYSIIWYHIICHITS